MVSISTSHSRGTVTDANVSITIFGATGNRGMSFLYSHSLLSSSLLSSANLFLQLYSGKGKTNQISLKSGENNFIRGFTYVYTPSLPLLPLYPPTRVWPDPCIHQASSLSSSLISQACFICIYLFWIFDLNGYGKNIAGNVTWWDAGYMDGSQEKESNVRYILFSFTSPLFISLFGYSD